MTNYLKMFYLWIVMMIFLVTPASDSISRAELKSSANYSIYQVKAISNSKILPDTNLVPGYLSKEIDMVACRGKYEPATFVIRATDKIKGLMATATDLRSGISSIPAGNVDIRVVKCWFQAGLHIRDTKKCLLTPELLLKDDKFIRVDLQQKKNYMRLTDSAGVSSYILISGKESSNLKDIQPRDAATLQPVDIEAGTNKQFWITVRVPEKATSGLYEGKIKLTAANSSPAEILVKLNVLPFNLEKPALRYSFYYPGSLTTSGKPYINSKNAAWKSSQQYLAELVDLKAHGIEFPTMYQQNEQLVREELLLREKAGLPKGTIYFLGLQTRDIDTPAKIDILRMKAVHWLKVFNQYGYQDVYFYGIDEAKGERLRSQRVAWQAVHAVGGKIFVACQRAFDDMGDLLDLAVEAGLPDPQLAANYHQVRHQIFSYNNPYGCQEEPETFRRNFGLLLAKARYDGAMNYAYQDAYGHIWNDFDFWDCRDVAFAYPTIDGVIDTLQWEGVREGIDDVRYLTTLNKAVQQAKETKPLLASKAQKWVDNMDPQRDLDTLRSEMIQWILQLR